MFTFVILCLFLLLVILWLRNVWYSLQPPEPIRPVSDKYLKQLEKFDRETIISSAFNKEKQAAYGHYAKAIKDVNVTTNWGFVGNLLSKLRLKQWHFQNVSTDDYFIGFAVFKASYIAKCFLFIVEKKTNTFYHYEGTSPLGIAVKHFQTSSIDTDSVTEWNNGKFEYIKIQYDSHLLGHVCDIRIALNKANPGSNKYETAKYVLEGSLSTFKKHGDEDSALLFPIDDNTPAYTHKLYGLHVAADLRLNDEKLNIENETALASLDWTKSYERYFTRWHWVTTVGFLKDGRRFGMSLTSSNRFRERDNFVALDGKIFPLPVIKFHTAPDAKDHWLIQSDDKKVDLYFKPIRRKDVKLNAFVIHSDYDQLLGELSGTIVIGDESIRFEKFWSGLEKQYVLW